MRDRTKLNSDLGVRIVSAFGMISVSASALWLGGIWFDIFAIIIGILCFAEFVGLALKISNAFVPRLLLIIFGLFYIGSAIYFITRINLTPVLLLIVGSVVCVDSFAYFLGRSIGGPKIAPKISPSKTWAGLCGGILGATLALSLYFIFITDRHDVRMPGLGDIWFFLLGFGAIIAILAQTGDFFESWLKRKAGVKDSSHLIPGHGGVFDRIDGMIPVAIALGLLFVNYIPDGLY